MKNITNKYLNDFLVGELFEIIKYDSNGDAVDNQFFRNKVPFSTIWEIYGDNSTLKKITRKMRFARRLMKKSDKNKKYNSFI